MPNDSLLYYCTLCKCTWGVYFFPNGTEWEKHEAIRGYGIRKMPCPLHIGITGKKLRRKELKTLREMNENNAD